MSFEVFGICLLQHFRLDREQTLEMNLLVIGICEALVFKVVSSVRVDKWDYLPSKIKLRPRPNMLQQLMDVQSTLELVGNNFP